MIVKIGDVISEYSVRNKFDENIPVYSVTNEKGFCTGYFSKEVASKDKSTYKIVPRGYFAYNPSRINVGSVDWQKYEDRVIVSPLYVVFGVSDRLDRQYLLHYLKSDMMLSFIKEYATGSVRDNLKLADLGEFPINLRPVEEQRQIAATLDKIDDLIAKRRQQLDKLDELVKSRFKQVTALNPELISVKLRMQYVEKYKKQDAFLSISEGDKGELLTQIAPLVQSEETDEFAKRFDNFMYGLILAHIEQMPAFKYAKKQLCDTASLLERKANIPQIKEKLPLLQEIHTDVFWDANDILLFEKVRKELRGLIRFLDEDDGGQKSIITKLTDPIIDSQEGVQLDTAYDFEDYRAKVNRYVNEHGNTLAIYKLTHNIPLAAGDYQELERVLTSELGSKEDYKREFGDTPFGLLIRKIAKLDHEAAMQAFSAFINDQSLNQKQIAFVKKIINHIELNGYMENVSELTKPPFDKPVSFIKLFDAKTRTALIATINQIRENAVQIVAS